MASDLGTLGYCIPKLTGSRAHQSASPVPLCFAQKHAARILSESSALRDGSRLGSNRGQYGEKRSLKERRRGKKKKKEKKKKKKEEKEGKWGGEEGGKGEKKRKGWLRMPALRNLERMVHSTRLSGLGRA